MPPAKICETDQIILILPSSFFIMEINIQRQSRYSSISSACISQIHLHSNYSYKVLNWSCNYYSIHDMTLKCPQIQSQKICFTIFPYAPRPPSISMLCMMIVLRTITCIYDHLSPYILYTYSFAAGWPDYYKIAFYSPECPFSSLYPCQGIPYIPQKYL